MMEVTEVTGFDNSPHLSYALKKTFQYNTFCSY